MEQDTKGSLQNNSTILSGCATCQLNRLAIRLPRALPYMDAGKGREQGAEALPTL